MIMTTTKILELLGFDETHFQRLVGSEAIWDLFGLLKKKSWNNEGCYDVTTACYSCDWQ